MGKPIDYGLVKKEKELRTIWVNKLNNEVFKVLRAQMPSGKNTDVIVYDPRDPSRKIHLEVEFVRSDRWEKIKGCKYETVRWPIAKKEKYREFQGCLVMVSVKEDLSDIFYIDYKKWVLNGSEEKAPFVRAGGKVYRYRKGAEERFWAIPKQAVCWGYDEFETYLLSLLSRC